MDIEEITGEQILDLPMHHNDAGATTIRAYLKALLSRVWELDEGFSGKRPFGNSGWTNDLRAPLVTAGFCKGYEEDGFPYITDQNEANLANELIFRAIEAL